MAKTQLLAQRFVVAVPNATNEAKVRLDRFRDWTSTVFSYGPPIGLQTDLNICDITQTNVLRYLSFEMRIHPRNAPPPHSPVPDLPGERCLQAVLKLPLTPDQMDVHPLCTDQTLRNIGPLLMLMKRTGWDITFGTLSPARTFDTALFDREFRGIKGECMFQAISAILLRDYVGKGITKDIQKRLRDCRQVQFIAGKRRVKTVEEQHADFMRLVQEFDVDDDIPANLPNIAFHNASWDIQQELVHMKYEPPSECRTTAEQYERLAEFHEKAKEAESRLIQMESMVKRMRGPGQQAATSFLTRIAPQDEAYLYEQAETEGIQWDEVPPHKHLQELEIQNNHLRAMLSVAEKAIRKASGEVAPLECWGCKDLPEFQEDKFHRYRVCPRRNDPKVRANFERNLRLWTTKKRSNSQYERPQTRFGDRQDKTRKIEETKKTFLSTVGGSEIGKSHPTGSANPLPGLGEISEETNLLTEFGICQEEETAGKQVRFQVNMARPLTKDFIANSSPTQEMDDEKDTPYTGMEYSSYHLERTLHGKQELEKKNPAKFSRTQKILRYSTGLPQNPLESAQALTAAKIIWEIKNDIGITVTEKLNSGNRGDIGKKYEMTTGEREFATKQRNK